MVVGWVWVCWGWFSRLGGHSSDPPLGATGGATELCKGGVVVVWVGSGFAGVGSQEVDPPLGATGGATELFGGAGGGGRVVGWVGLCLGWFSGGGRANCGLAPGSNRCDQGMRKCEGVAWGFEGAVELGALLRPGREHNWVCTQLLLSVQQRANCHVAAVLLALGCRGPCVWHH